MLAKWTFDRQTVKRNSVTGGHRLDEQMLNVLTQSEDGVG